MRYIFFSFGDDKYWIELDNENFALRQIMLLDDGYHFSCMEDCLAEGKIIDVDLSDDIVDISSIEFDNIWNKAKKIS